MTLKEIFSSVKIGLLFVGTIVGAGFASGKELLSFFGELGLYIIPVSIVVGILFILTSWLFLKIGTILRPKELNQITKAYYGKASIVMDIFIIFSYFIVFSAMLAGVDSIFEQAFGFDLGFPLFSLITAGLAVVVMFGGMKGLVAINAILVPLIVIFIIGISFLTLSDPETTPIVMKASENIGLDILLVGINSVLYVSMNMMLTAAVLGDAGKDLSTKKITLASIIGGAIIMVCVILVLFAIYNVGVGAVEVDLPTLHIATLYGNASKIIASIIIWFAVFTTLISSVYPIMTWSDKFFKKRYFSLPIIMVIGFIIASFGFSKIVDFLFPIMGAVGMFFIISSLIFYIKKRNKNNTKLASHNNDKFLKTPSNIKGIAKSKIEENVNNIKN